MLQVAPIAYWFPGVRRPPADFAEEVCERYGVIGYDEVPKCESADSEGPLTGKRGYMVGLGSARAVAYMPGLYRYEEYAPGRWIGAHAKATPEDFLRRRDAWGGAFYPIGRPVRLADGREWLVPTANPQLASIELPCSDVLVRGNWTRVPKPCAERLAELALAVAEDYRAAFFGGCAFAMAEDDLRRACMQFLNWNYDLSAQEGSALRTFDRDSWRAILESAIDWDGFLAILKAEAGTASGENFTEPPEADASSASAPGTPARSSSTQPARTGGSSAAGA